MKRSYSGLLIVLISALLLVGISPLKTRAAPQSDQPPVDQAISQAVEAAIQENRLDILALMLYQTQIFRIDYSADGRTALVWLEMIDPSTGDVVETEPGLTIVRNLQDGDAALAASWTVSLPNAADWGSLMDTLPEELVNEDLRQLYSSQTEQILPTATGPFTGYRLPWVAGLQKRVTNSIGHVYTVSGGLTSCPNTCRYAFDFADGTMFSLVASKGGTVKAWKTNCPNNDHTCTNYFVLEDQSTSPVSYQLYFHMMYESVPTNLRQVGAQVLRGQFIGNVDNTGASTGSHLHYHVYTSVTGSNWSWGPSVDFVFEDVNDNGGRPRTCAEASAYPNLGSQCQPNNLYTSGNTPAFPPHGDITYPNAGTTNTKSAFSVTGFSSDDIKVTKVQILGLVSGVWKTLGDATLNSDGSFSKSIDVCQAQIPIGSFDLALRIYDWEGNQAEGYPGRRTIQNSYYCYTPPPPPACQPGANEVALYAGTDFMGTACKRFAVGKYDSTQLGSLGNETASSIQVGANVRAILYDFSSDLTDASILSRIETIETSDANLADNWIGDNHVSAVWVQNLPLDSANASDLEPFLTDPGQVDNLSPTAVDSLVLAWEGGEGANQFWSEIRRASDNAQVRLFNWQYAYSWSIGNLPAGDYIWSVTARNSAYPAVTNNTALPFTVTSASLPSPAAAAVPASNDFESGVGDWAASGLWRLASVERGNRPLTNAWIYNNGTDYKDSVRRGGDLTSPPYQLPSGGPFYLRFSTYSQVEDGNPYWDQRRVQISINDGAFTDLYQFSDDWQEGPVWLDSPAIKLVDKNGTPVSNARVRIRFHFDTIDEDYNAKWGWMIDNFSINSTAPNVSCADTNNLPAQAQTIGMGGIVQGTICPAGDIDYFAITLRAGQVIQVDLDANPTGLSSATDPTVSLLDSYIFLLNSNGKDVLAENDDEYPNSVLKDSRMAYTVQRDGTYYVKVRAWDNPGAGGAQYYYSFKVYPFAGKASSLYLPQISR